MKKSKKIKSNKHFTHFYYPLRRIFKCIVKFHKNNRFSEENAESLKIFNFDYSLNENCMLPYIILYL